MVYNAVSVKRLRIKNGIFLRRMALKKVLYQKRMHNLLKWKEKDAHYQYYLSLKFNQTR